MDDIIKDYANSNIYQLGHILLVHTCAGFDNDNFVGYEVMMKNALNIFTREYRRLYIYVYIYIYIDMDIYMCMCVYMYIYMYYFLVFAEIRTFSKYN